jgi:dTDP-4-amino-4,6-dideoxy-D-glucose/dTDP-4-amino-2,4-dideoxy-beta-L-xylose transaminase
LKEIQEKALRMYGFKPAIIEDCAHALGSKFNGKPLGSHGNICTFSFQAIKHMTSVDGGALVLPHKELYSRAKLLRWYGIDRESDRKDFRCEADIPEWGFKFHMNDVSAAIGMANLAEAEKNVIANILVLNYKVNFSYGLLFLILTAISLTSVKSTLWSLSGFCSL